MLCRGKSLGHHVRAEAAVALGSPPENKVVKEEQAHPGGDGCRACGLCKPPLESCLPQHRDHPATFLQSHHQSHPSPFVDTQALKLDCLFSPSSPHNQILTRYRWKFCLMREKTSGYQHGISPHRRQHTRIDRQDGFSVSEEWFCLSSTAHR